MTFDNYNRLKRGSIIKIDNKEYIVYHKINLGNSIILMFHDSYCIVNSNDKLKDFEETGFYLLDRDHQLEVKKPGQ